MTLFFSSFFRGGTKGISKESVFCLFQVSILQLFVARVIDTVVGARGNVIDLTSGVKGSILTEKVQARIRVLVNGIETGVFPLSDGSSWLRVWDRKSCLRFRCRLECKTCPPPPNVQRQVNPERSTVEDESETGAFRYRIKSRPWVFRCSNQCNPLSDAR